MQYSIKDQAVRVERRRMRVGEYRTAKVSKLLVVIVTKIMHMTSLQERAVPSSVSRMNDQRLEPDKHGEHGKGQKKKTALGFEPRSLGGLSSKPSVLDHYTMQSAASRGLKTNYILNLQLQKRRYKKKRAAQKNIFTGIHAPLGFPTASSTFIDQQDRPT